MNKAVQLLIEWDTFDQTHPEADIEQFCRYYLAKQEQKKGNSQYSQGLLLKIMGRITSAFSFYHRAAMSKTKLPSPESFYFLNGLAHLGEVKKTDLINYLFYEYTTGMSVIQEILKHNLIAEKSAPTDKRAKLINLTDKGKQVLNESYAQSARVNQMLFKGMKEDSVKLCIELLKDIEEKHSKLVIELKNMDFDEMYQKVCK
jgi:DNA-binding MarR family transcriptional regulator